MYVDHSGTNLCEIRTLLSIVVFTFTVYVRRLFWMATFINLYVKSIYIFNQFVYLNLIGNKYSIVTRHSH